MANCHITIRYAEKDTDVVAIHRFLCVVAGPLLPAPIDARDSVEEIFRVCRNDVGLMAITDGELVGTLGLVGPKFWWNTKIRFLVNRWFFVLPHSGAARPLLREACAIAKASQFELHILDENRRRYRIFNASGSRGTTKPTSKNHDNEKRA